MLLVKSVVLVLLGSCTCFGQNVEDFYGNSQSVVSAKKNQDVAILKQIHRHNEDGSYTYGYEGADGSFKIETKTRSGEVTGKYGYVDDLGKLRVVEYGANKHGFQPSGEGITVPPPTLVQLRSDDDDDDNVTPDAGRPQQAKRPSPVKIQQNKRPVSRDDGIVDYNDGFSQQQQQQPTPNVDFDDSDSPAGWAVQSADDQSWSSQPQKPAARPRASSVPSYRPAPASGRFGASSAARPKSPPPVPVGGSFEAVPSTVEGPSGSYQSVQDFGGARRLPSVAVGRREPPSSGRRLAAEPSYETFEDQESVTEAPLYRPAAAKPAAARRNNNGGSGPAWAGNAPPRPSSRQMRTSGILDQLAEQYALPESGSPVSHSVSFGSDQQ